MSEFTCSRDCTHDDRCDDWVRHQKAMGAESEIDARIAAAVAAEREACAALVEAELLDAGSEPARLIRARGTP